MQPPARYTRRHPSLISHTPRAFAMDPDGLPDLPPREEARSLPQLSSLEYDPFEDFDQPSQFRSASVSGYSYSTPPDLDTDTYDHDRPSSPLEGNEEAPDYFQSRFHKQSLSTTDTGHATSTTSISSPRPRFWNSADSADFECAVAGEYSPYDNDLSHDPERHHHSASERLHTSHSLNFLNMKAPPILPAGLQRQASLPMNSPSFDLAYFLKNTGPPGQRGGAPSPIANDDARRKSKHKSPLRFLRVGTRKSLASRVGSVEGPGADKRDNFPESFVPPEGVIQKVSSDGKKYLQIVTEDKSTVAHLDIPISNDNRKKHSVAFSDRTDTPETDVLESWLSTFNLQRQAEDEPSSNNAMIKTVKLIEQHDHSKVRHEEGEMASAGHEGASHDPPISSSNSSPTHDSYTADHLDHPDNGGVQSQAPDAKAALFSNPPSTRQSTSEITRPRPHVTSPASDSDSVELPEFPQPPQSEESPTSFERGKERLAGQGMRRPSPEQVKEAEEGAEPPPKDDEHDNDHTREDSGVGQLGQRDPSEFGLGAKDSTKKSREDRIRARKLRDMQRVKSNIDEVIGRTVETPTSPTSMSLDNAPVAEKQLELSSKITEDPERPTSELSTVRSSLDSRPQGDDHSRHVSIDTISTAPPATPGSTTGCTPTSSRMSFSLTPVMLVAEQVPVNKSKHIKKPARLVLRDRQTSTSTIIASQDSSESNTESATVAPRPQDSVSAHNMAFNATSEKKQDHFIKDNIVPSRVSSHRSVQVSQAEKTLEQTGMRHFSAPANMSLYPITTPISMSSPLTTTESAAATPLNKVVLQNQHHRHTASQASRASIASSLLRSASNATRDQRLEARVESLERENKLLEAALMAVLKSGGRLNKCPCRLAGGGEKHDDETEENRGSALEVYLATRVANSSIV